MKIFKCATVYLMVLLFCYSIVTGFGQGIIDEKRIFSVLSDNPSDKNYCSAFIKDSLLVIENSRIIRKYKWNNGNIITVSITDKSSRREWKSGASSPDIFFPGQTSESKSSSFSVKRIPSGAVIQSHLEAEILCTLGDLHVRRILRIYPNCPVIACDLYFKGSIGGKWTDDADSKTTIYQSPFIEKVELQGKHWEVKAVEFFDCTDRNNTLVQPVTALSFHGNVLRGNLFFLNDITSHDGLFILKESPTSQAQLAYPGGDLVTEYGTVKLCGIGIVPKDLKPDEWRRGYSFVTGVYNSNDLNRLSALRDYQGRLRTHLPDRDEMILMNTWGDRSQGSKISEKFILKELEAAARLGITHFQIDDGWQTGVSGNQTGRFNNIWSKKDYWELDPLRFPNGLDTIMKKARELNIEICLWFNPSGDFSNANWEKDAEVLVGFFNKYGIRTFKIDGVNLPDKTAEINFRKMLDKVVTATESKAVFNLDVTAGQRGGYNLFNEYGNLFLENRYTDWQNYYPYQTLRNLWMLSEYIPSQNLQIEFLNIWRNKEMYQGDPFGPGNYSFEYIFAITMMAQPLAWFEATGLPEEAFRIAPLIKKYKSMQYDIHSGMILPIGEEPDGSSWTGFQSIKDEGGYFLVFREKNKTNSFSMKTWLNPGCTVKCTPVFGAGKSFETMTDSRSRVKFFLEKENSYCLYKYKILKFKK